VLGDLLGLAVAIAVSPVPVIAVVLMLISAGGRGNAIALLAGWAVTLTVVVVGVALLGIGGASSDDGGGHGVAVAQLGLAAILAVMIAIEWRGRHRSPRWMALLSDLGPGRALALGVALVALNAKDGALAVAAGAKLGDGAPAVPAAILDVALFVLIASTTVIAPLAVDLALGDRAGPILHGWHAWLERHGATAVITTLGVIVAVLVVQGGRGL
jgi:hypothetical protein